jgi:sugar lactone lactonase YvrE
MQKCGFLRLLSFKRGVVLLSTSVVLILPEMSCKMTHAALWQSQDVTAEHLFTTNCEGPATDKHGNLFVVNIGKDGTVALIRENTKPTVFLNLPEGSIGNGIRFNKSGDMFIADFKGHNVLKVDIKTKKINVFAHSDQFNQPNDIAISNTGILFASDPNWSNSTGAIWKIMPDGQLVMLESKMGTTNGIEVSPDNKHLYVNESAQLKIWKYNLDADGNISGKRLFYQFKDFGLDGMRCDAKGNLYVARYGMGCIAVLSPDGNLIREIKTKGFKTSNVTFGGKGNKTIYVTLQDRGAIESFLNDIKGAR